MTDNTPETKGEGRVKKKKKPNRGYAFIVYEREKDMKGKIACSIPFDSSIAGDFD